MIPAFNINGPNSQFLGFPMLQNRFAVPAWSYLFEKWKPVLLIEIGTWTGGFTCCLGIAGKLHGFVVHSVDRGQQCEDLRPWFNFLGIIYHRADIKTELPALAALVQRCPGHVAILCDGGDKPGEFRAFADVLRNGDVIAAHDYTGDDDWPWQEITMPQIAESVAKNRLKPFFPSVFANTGWLVMRKVGT